MRCCRRSCSSCCASGGCSRGRLARAGCSRAAIRSQPLTTRQLNRAVPQAAAQAAGIEQAGVAAHAAAQLRHAPAGAGHRHPRDPGAARARQARHDGALHAASPPTRSATVTSPLDRLTPLRPRRASRRHSRRAVARPALEVADIFRDHGAAWRQANAGHVSLGQLKVMTAIESCRTAALGGHVARCEDCAHTTIAYNSCRNRHCPKCQGAAARRLAGAARGRAAAGALLPRRLHAAGRDRRHRLPEQGA